MPTPPWLERQKRVVTLSRGAWLRLEQVASLSGAGVSTTLDAFLRDSLPVDPHDGATVVMGRLDADMVERARWEELSDDAAGT